MLQEKDCEHDLKGKGQYPAEQIKRTGKSVPSSSLHGFNQVDHPSPKRVVQVLEALRSATMSVDAQQE